MLDIFLIILPVFLLLATGYVSARTGYLGKEIADPLNTYTVKLAVPVLLFRALYRLDMSQAFEPLMLVGFYVGALASFALGIVLARIFWSRRPGEAVAVGFCALFSNTVFLGLPIVERAFGPDSLTPAFGIVALHAPILYAVGLTVMELSRRDGRPMSEVARAAIGAILGNTLMIGILIGAAFNLAGIRLPEPAIHAVDMIAASAIPVALVAIGASLTRYRLKAELSESLMVSALSLVLHPLITLILTWYVFGLPIEFVRAAVVVAAMPPGMNVYIFATMFDRAVAVAASSVLVATALSVMTATAWLFILQHWVAG